jgi:hypothetical protein
MVKTKHLVIGAAALSVTILTLYKIAQPRGDHFLMLFRPNQTSNRGSTSPSQILTTIKLPVDSPAKQMFENELSRITSNLKSGRIADQNPDPPVVYYRNELSQQEPEVVLPNVPTLPQKFASLPNQVLEANLEMQSVYDKQIPQNIQNIELPSNSNGVKTQNMYQNLHLPDLVKNKNMHNIKLPKRAAKQKIAKRISKPMPNAQVPPGWKIINENVHNQRSHAGLLPQFINQSADQNQQKTINNEVDSVWQPIEQKSQLSDLIQSVQKDKKDQITY